MSDFHIEGLGKLLANFLSLETILRSFLQTVEAKRDPKRRATYDLDAVKVGDRLPVDAFTNYHQLRRLIDNYNAEVGTVDSAYCVDPTVVEVRDAISHGRAFTSDRLPLRLFKFTKADSTNNVTVTHCDELNEDWFRDKRGFVVEQIRKVELALKRLP